MSGIWQAHEAGARFGEFLDACVREGPQIVTRHGVETAVLLPIGQWREMQETADPGLKDLLFTPET